MQLGQQRTHDPVKALRWHNTVVVHVYMFDTNIIIFIAIHCIAS